ncbi:ammonia-forming cytochrome c nitrite reductase subunit c552 [Pleionea sp. CnH1-48]|uniref:ammonia-forming cytochrome c nitrite reductase subunit c552 n=1 Tax=Pleionea sp. CnH1-48 TaxID=2954494 RepID=UPI0020985D48|nr:ammonia-forming cytochrome c nitrite reductase subunit c552 [Pleionea sp. CnH1-48]MCO7222798.1 ammonia-forming cytochrome c nitrite reductase subunit c552 [Pleionea sp. CnH1-48]
MTLKKTGFIIYGITVTLLLSAVLGYNLLSGDQSYFLAGDATHGHYQIELACNSCHQTPFATEDDMQEACENCHQQELKRVNDSHPKKKFTDPRNAEMLEMLDARFCVSCHKEHKPEITRQYGVTIADDFCFHCHEEVTEERPSHADFKFDTCATSGCHNYHDNSMLYEKFLMRNMKQADVKKKPKLPKRNSMRRWQKKNPEVDPLQFHDHDGDKLFGKDAIEAHQWAKSQHAQAAVNCSGCHQISKEQSSEVPHLKQAIDTCRSCHEKQFERFTLGKHGMRIASGLPAMSPVDARQPMKPQLPHSQVTCQSCHNPHTLDMQQAAVESCLSCHQDQHSVNYKQSSHYQLWLNEVAGDGAPGTGVSCASCHMPRIKKGKKVTVEHNQNRYLEPNTKMLKPVCMKCHGLEFSVAALSDEVLIETNFNSKPDKSHPTFELIKKRLQQRLQQQSN